MVDGLDSLDALDCGGNLDLARREVVVKARVRVRRLAVTKRWDERWEAPLRESGILVAMVVVGGAVTSFKNCHSPKG